MTRDEIVEALVGLGVPIALLVNLPSLPEGTRGLLIYGSQARGDAVSGSDVDLLALTSAQRPSINAGDVNISFYTRDQLSTGVGTLFGAHLNRDSKIVWDEGGLTETIRAMGEVDTDRLIQRVRQMSELFTSLQRDLPKYLPGLLREARYLLRSCLYAEAIEVGKPCFSVRELAERHRDPALSSLLTSRPLGEASSETLNECLVRLHRIVGDFPQSSHGSLEATVVNEWERPGDLLSMAFLALGITGQGSNYAEVEKILL